MCQDSNNYKTEADRQEFLNQIEDCGDMLTILREIEHCPTAFTKETMYTVFKLLREKFNITCI